jgi:hypothetical protein
MEQLQIVTVGPYYCESVGSGTGYLHNGSHAWQPDGSNDSGGLCRYCSLYVWPGARRCIAV